MTSSLADPAVAPPALDPREPLNRLLRDLGARPDGLSQREAARRIAQVGPNELSQHGGRSWPRALLRQLTHPLALLLILAAVLAVVADTAQLAWAIAAAVVINAVFAFVQENQASKAVEALGRYLPPQATVRRGGVLQAVPAAELVPGDVIVLAEGDRVPADARLLSGAVEIDASALTGESVPVLRSADALDDAERRLDSPVLVFSGTGCTVGTAEAVAHATGAHSEIGRIAALAGHRRPLDSPLERQIRRVALLIAAVAVAVGVAFLPLGVMAGLSFTEAFTFAVGLLVANMPEGLLPTITLALAAGVRTMARRGLLVKRLSAVETLGSTSVICTDKTGTLTLGAMHVRQVRGPDGRVENRASPDVLDAVVRCATADVAARTGDPTELALLDMADAAGRRLDPAARDRDRVALYAFDPRRRRMTTLDRVGTRLRAHQGRSGGDPAALRAHAHRTRSPRHRRRGDGRGGAARARRRRSGLGRPEGRRSQRHRGARPGAARPHRADGPAPTGGPRPEVRAAVAACHDSGIRIHVVTGDNGRTASEIARQVGIHADRVVDGLALDALSDRELDPLLAGREEIVFSRAAPEATLRIADVLHDNGQVVAMTGDGVNDAPALRHADIGVAMGRSGTEVAREAATVVLTDDNFATVVAGVEEGRRVYDNVRKFVLYIFAHAVPEVVPFLLFALSGGAIPLPLTVLQILAIDLGTETLPALALGREPAEPGIMTRPPRRPGQNVIDRRMLLRAWVLMGIVSAALGTGLFLAVLLAAGWTPGAPTGSGSPLHAAYLQATTATFLAIVACQIGTAFAARTEHSSLRRVGLTTNPLLLWGIAFEVVFAAALTTLPPLRWLFGTTLPSVWALLLLLPMPVVVWGVDEAYRAARARKNGRRAEGAAP